VLVRGFGRRFALQRNGEKRASGFGAETGGQMDKDIVTYVAQDMSEEPITYEPASELSQRAWELHTELIHLGNLAQEKRIDLEDTWRLQGKILKELLQHARVE